MRASAFRLHISFLVCRYKTCLADHRVAPSIGHDVHVVGVAVRLRNPLHASVSSILLHGGRNQRSTENILLLLLQYIQHPDPKGLRLNLVHDTRVLVLTNRNELTPTMFY